MDAKLTKVLTWVNGIRAELGLSRLAALPRAAGIMPKNCAIATAFNTETTRGDFGFASGSIKDSSNGALLWDSLWLPEFIQDFIHAYCRGEYPELREPIK